MRVQVHADAVIQNGCRQRVLGKRQSFGASRVVGHESAHRRHDGAVARVRAGDGAGGLGYP